MFKMKNLKKYLFVSVLLVAVSIFAACEEDSTSQESTSDETSDSSEVKEENDNKDEKEKEEQIYKIGDTVKINDVELIINSASFTEPAEYGESKNGKVLTLDLSAKNTGDEQVFVDNTEFAIYDNEGNKQDDYYSYDEMAFSEQINSGKQAQGKIYFDVVEQDSYEMIYTPSFSWDNEEYVFEIVPK
ncbi:MAG: DUF4352 domain-containing protein [Senegalia sp. (in: firmicutes)]|uniref:DUF4352 domain-containing protein n=1 Tax=Senegalia sp. (in: firmicutes) TaxID=1924098 RepID=UPI003F96212D